MTRQILADTLSGQTKAVAILQFISGEDHGLARTGFGLFGSSAGQHDGMTDSNPADPLRKHQPALSSGRDEAAYALRVWLAPRTDDASAGSHPYVVRKGIKWAAGAGRGLARGKLVGDDANCLMVPIHTKAKGMVQVVQRIYKDRVSSISAGRSSRASLSRSRPFNRTFLESFPRGGARVCIQETERRQAPGKPPRERHTNLTPKGDLYEH